MFFLNIRVIYRPLSVSFQFRASGKEFHSQAGSTTAWELRLAMHKFSRRGVFILMSPIQLSILSHNYQLCPPPFIILHLPTSGCLILSQLSTLLHQVAWCLDTSGWFVAPAIHGAVCPSCICQMTCLDILILLSSFHLLGAQRTVLYICKKNVEVIQEKKFSDFIT